MKITRIKTFVLEAGIFVKGETDAGIYGWGESGFSGRELAVSGLVEPCRPWLSNCNKTSRMCWTRKTFLASTTRSTALKKNAMQLSKNSDGVK